MHEELLKIAGLVRDGKLEEAITRIDSYRLDLSRIINTSQYLKLNLDILDRKINIQPELAMPKEECHRWASTLAWSVLELEVWQRQAHFFDPTNHNSMVEQFNRDFPLPHYKKARERGVIRRPIRISPGPILMVNYEAFIPFSELTDEDHVKVLKSIRDAVR